jgi:hypothetical protein
VEFSYFIEAELVEFETRIEKSDCQSEANNVKDFNLTFL